MPSLIRIFTGQGCIVSSSKTNQTAQADLSLRSAHMSEGMFSYFMVQTGLKKFNQSLHCLTFRPLLRTSLSSKLDVQISGYNI